MKIKVSKNFWTILLMSSSMILLLVLQFLWLTNAYRNEREALFKETSNLFRNTVMSMQDSLILGTMQQISPDSTDHEVFARYRTHDSLRMKMALRTSELPRHLEFRDSVSQIQIYISSSATGDSVKQVLRPIVKEFRRTRQPGNFVFRIGPDSLKVKDIESNYTTALAQADIFLHPQVSRLERPDLHIKGKRNGFFTEPFFLPHSPSYIAYFDEVNPTLLTKISPQILFSTVLTLLTGTAFFFMYRSIRSQQRLMQLKNDLISNITHELKTPVATVSVALEALKNFNALDNPKLTQEYLEIAQNELNRLTMLTDKILKTSAFEENGLDLKAEQTDLEKIIEQVLSTFKLVFEKHGARVDFEKSGSNFILNGSAAHLTNVVFNLLDNALKYSQQGCMIHIHLKEQTGQLQLSVEDTGVGIPVEYQKKVFEKFFRVPTGDVHNSKGYGLGLSYVAGVVKAHGGKIWVESEVGKGSKFILEIPRNQYWL